MEHAFSARQILSWHLDVGVDETIAEQPHNRLTPKPKAPKPQPQSESTKTDAKAAPVLGATNEILHDAFNAAMNANSLEDLRTVLEKFDGCPLKKTATRLVFGAGNPNADIVMIGEAPGAEEDRKGEPFVGPSGHLLDAMLGSIQIERSDVFISNTVFWRPPGNRSPTTAEIATCMPFVERILELIDPKILIAIGGPAASALLAKPEGVGKLRGKWFSYSTPRLSCPIEATAIYHPAYLLRSPGQKRLAWRDLLAIRKKLADLS
jgi:uracil-DNA glycosylase